MDDIRGHHIREAMQAAGITRAPIMPCPTCGAARFYTADPRYVRLFCNATCACELRHPEVNWHEAAQLVKSNPQLAPGFGLKPGDS